MIDLVQAQKDLTSIMLSAQLLRTVNIYSYREQRLKQEMDYRAMLSTPRNGKAGAGVIVLMPEASDNNPSVSGPVLGWTFGIVVQEMDAINMDPALGTLLAAETICQYVMDVLHLEADELYGTFSIDRRALSPEKEYVFPGCIGYRITVALLVGRSVQTARVSSIQCAIDSVPVTKLTAAAGVLTLTSATDGTRIRYTTNGTYPTDINGDNPEAKDYDPEDPPTVESGDEVRVSGYADGLNKSAGRFFVIN